jgi:cysteine synthase
MQNIERSSRPTTTQIKMDLSNMSDKEMRDKINRELLERQYNNLFAEVSQPTVSKGREIVNSTLSTAGTALAITSSALGIALAIKELKG